jgi:hypothetical protein
VVAGGDFVLPVAGIDQRLNAAVRLQLDGGTEPGDLVQLVIVVGVRQRVSDHAQVRNASLEFRLCVDQLRGLTEHLNDRLPMSCSRAS